MNLSRLIKFPLLTGFLLPLTFAPLPFGFLAHVSLVPLFLGINEKDRKASFRWGFSTGFVFFLGLLYWINFIKVEGSTIFFLPLGVLLLLLYQSLFIGIFSFFLSSLQKRFGDRAYLMAPPLWTALEFLRTLTTYGFPWGSLAYTQSSYIPLIQFADTTGVPGVTFWVVSVNTTLFYLLKRNFTGGKKKSRTLLPLSSLFLLFIFPLLYGYRVLRTPVHSPEITVAIAQADVPSSIRKDPFQAAEERFEILKNISYGVYQKGAGLLIWPETAAPGFPRIDQEIREKIEGLAKELEISILMGTGDSQFGMLFNSAMLVDPEKGLSQSYNKILLVPFGERLPFDDILPVLRRLELGQGRYSPGKEKTVFQLRIPQHDPRITKFTTLICYESIFPWFVRDSVLLGANFLANITDDSWFGRTSGPFQHAQMTVFRAIENRRALARCANTGISMVIDPYGRVKRKTGIFTRVLLLERLPLRQDLTFYTRFGDIFAWISVALSLLALIWRGSKLR